MTDTSEIVMCIVCSEHIPSTATCSGCSKDFCRNHFNDHRNGLLEDLRDVRDYHNQLSQSLQDRMNSVGNSSPNYENLHLIDQINEWEKRTIDRVSTIAEEARVTVQSFINPTEQYGIHKKRLATMMEEFERQEKTECYVETDIDDWTNQLDQLKVYLDRLSKMKTQPPVLQIEDIELSDTIKILFPRQVSQEGSILQEIDIQLQATLEKLISLSLFSEQGVQLSPRMNQLMMNMLNKTLKRLKREFVEFQEQTFSKWKRKLSLEYELMEVLQHLLLTLSQTLVRQLHKELSRKEIQGKILMKLDELGLNKKMILSTLEKPLFNLTLKVLEKSLEELKERDKLLHLNSKRLEDVVLVLVLELLVGLHYELNKKGIKSKLPDANQQNELKELVKDKIARWLQESSSSSSESDGESD
ncbi:unnamed protein product [Adineta ricciae]|uniref:Uncharacterized protein n=1 Tax=Adineta ricciae TaxID=249248 RepID=A0A815SM92_ADIRI|nr:unnamed protein product [Adineta ricciae]CAF1491658.1 unnamed protein product [Adineta ricciae]